MSIEGLKQPMIRANGTETEMDELPLPKIERMYKPRGTLTEKDHRETFERGPSPEAIDLSARSGGAITRLTPKSETRHVPSGPRDLKDYDQPAYLRRGITLPPIDEAGDEEQPALAGALASSRQTAPKERDDRPAFLKRIMD